MVFSDFFANYKRKLTQMLSVEKFTLDGWRAVGYKHATFTNLEGGGRLIEVAGMTDLGEDEAIRNPGDLVKQFEGALRNIRLILGKLGATPANMTRMTIYTTNMAVYRLSLAALGRVYKAEFGREYTATALIGVASLSDPDAMVEILVTAVT